MEHPGQVVVLRVTFQVVSGEESFVEPNEPAFDSAECKGKAKQPPAEAADTGVEQILDKHTVRIFLTDLSALQQGEPKLHKEDH